VAKGRLGKEIDWTPVVANEAVRMLTEAGVNAVKETAHIKVTQQQYRCKLAIFVHFDAPDSGESGPSVGYDHDSDADAADEWKTLYKEYFPYNDTWLRDNATGNERDYYGFQYTITSDAEFLVELGDLTSLRQAEWLKPRLKWLGQLLAYFVSNRIDKGGLQKPDAFVPEVAGNFGIVKTAPNDPLNLREAPSTDASIITTLNNGAQVTVLGGQDVGSTWLNVSAAGKSGWVAARYIEIAPSDRPDSAVFSNGETTLPGTWLFDLDNGAVTATNPTADLFWEQETDTKRSLNPMNGALLALVGQRDFDSLELQMLKGLDYLSDNIRADNDLSNAIPNGTVLAYKTKHGRYGKLLIENYAYNLKVKWLTFGP